MRPFTRSTLIGTLLFITAALGWLPPFASAHVPLPDSVLNPQSAPEAWNVLRLAVANIERLLREDRLAEVPDQASLCSPALRWLAHEAQGSQRQKEFAAETVRAASAVTALAQGCVAGDRASIDRAWAKLHVALDALAVGTDPMVVNADIFFCAMHPEVVTTDGKMLCPKCGMALTPRRIPYSFVYVAPPGEPSMQLTTLSDAPPQSGRLTRVKIRLARKDGSPVEMSDLLVAHTQRIHLLIIDPALEDYHHEHPTPTGTPGEYEFTFTPSKTASYRIYADVVPDSTGVQEYIRTVLSDGAAPTVGAPAFPDWQDKHTTSADGLQFELVSDASQGNSFHVGQTRVLTVVIRGSDGQPFARLEPVMNAFAHLVGFYDDDRTVVHLHPAGAEVEDAKARGGPTLAFRFYPPRDGLLRLFCQVSVDGKMIFVPFNLHITR